MKVGILGGGLTGLTVGNKLRHQFEILESEDECGGLCRSINQRGFTYDYGGCHILFSKNRAALDLMLNALGSNTNKNRRNNKVLYDGRYVKYPFENDLSALAPADRFACLYGFVQARLASHDEKVVVRNLADFCYQTFGAGISDAYLIPYNDKIWKRKATDLSADWARQRMPQPPLEDIVKSAVGIETEGYVHQLYYHYPLAGGIQSLIEALEAPIRDRILTNFRVKSIELTDGIWQVSDGRTTRTYDRLVSTIPVFDLAAAIGRVPKSVARALDNLRYNRLITVAAGLDLEYLNDFTAVYIPDRGVLPHRVGFPSNFSNSATPPGKSSVLAEITSSTEDTSIWDAPDEAVAERVLDDLTRVGIIPRGTTIDFWKVHRTEYAYVVEDHFYADSTRSVREFFDGLGIVQVGRFAEFDYLNMDACVHNAIAVAEELNRNG